MNNRSSVAAHDAASAAIPAGGGEMGALIRALDWSATPLGAAHTWPATLKTALGILLDSGYPMYLAWGAKFTQIYNDAYRPILGRTKHPDALGASTRDTFAEIWTFIGPMFERVLETGEASTFVDGLLGLDRNGFIEECYFTFSYSAVRDGDRVGGVFVTVLETTERVLRERRQESLRRLTNALNSIGVQHVHEAAVAALEENRSDMPFVAAFMQEVGGPTLAAHGGVDEHTACALISRFPPPTDGRATLHDLPDGQALTLPPWPEPVTRVVVIPIVVPGGAAPIAFIAVGLSPRLAFDADYARYLDSIADRISRAITEAQALEAERRRAEALAEIDRAKTVFFSNVSHEFRTPLTLMLNPVDELLDAPAAALCADQRELLSLVKRNGLRLQRLVNTLLDFSRLEAGRAEASFQSTDIAMLTRDVASNFRSAIERAGLAFEVDCPTLDEQAFIDRDMWEKIVLNLLSNAFKFTLKGKIAVRLRRDGRCVRLDVQDTGVGVAAAELPRIFERFHRAPGVRGRTIEGTGIGLSLVRELVELHGGEATVSSVESVGATFSVQIPLGVEHLDAKRIGASRALASTAMSASAFIEEALRWLPDQAQSRQVGASTHTNERSVILLADDNADMRTYIRRLLEPLYEVESAADGRAALAAFERRKPSLVLADIMMPHLDGFGLLKAIRAQEDGSQTPVILLSARAGEEHLTAGIEVGADDYLVKPFSSRELLARIAARMEMVRLRNEPARRAEARVRELSAESSLLRQLFDQATSFIAVLRGPEHIYELANSTYLTAVAGREVIGLPVREALPELEGQGIFELLDEVYASGKPHIGRSVGMILNRGPGGAPEEAYFDFLYQPIHEADGSVSGVFVEGSDVTHRELAKKRQSLLIEELNHRVKNTLATVQSIAFQTFRNAADQPAAQKAFEARLIALSRAHSLLTNSHWKGALLLDALRQELAPYGSERALIAGPPVILSAKASLSIIMLAHELSTNAAKYGAFSAAGGRVDVTWSIERSGETPLLQLVWREFGGPAPPPRSRRGFGSRLIDMTVRELRGEVKIVTPPDGLRCEMSVPLVALQAEDAMH